MSGLRFSANLSMMFKESESLLDRVSAAAANGFKAVEIAFPYSEAKASVLLAQAQRLNVDVALINVWPGSHLGYAAVDGHRQDFTESLNKSVEYCKAVNCKRLHIMSGKSGPGLTLSAATLEANLRSALPVLQANGIVGLIEPINNYSVPGYFLNDYDLAERLVQDLNSPHLRLQLDIFHLQFLRGNLTKNIQRLLPITGHIQIAQVPDRHEPDSAGEIDYDYVLDLIRSTGYDGYVGLEYVPKANTVAGLAWIKKYRAET